MSMFNMNAGHNGTVAEGYITENKEIVKMLNIVGEHFRVWGFIITKPGTFGEGVLLCADQYMVSLPKRYVEVFRSFTPEQVDQLKSGNTYVYDIKAVPAAKPGQKDTVSFEMEPYEDYKKWLDSRVTTV